ncbi:acyl-CoA dehydrogenase family protein [Paenibacillus alvei]|uniref:Acyl-CoA dehydrogenase n=1 Tax=Paenibacillus alvei TaxID=44250 RepID=A0AAP7DIK3_PAEAL|nr:acyl-CoA dehydrogenase family protein [Paenibacillus alvei]NOJ71677.1 acyl-CoA dehydrogenase [Paenibacillus alvei]
MHFNLTPEQQSQYEQFKHFVDQDIVPIANSYDQLEKTPRALIDKLASLGYLGALIPNSYGGSGMDMITFGLLNEELGRGCSSIRSLLTVHTMASQAIIRFGTEEQKETWLPAMAIGHTIGAFALSEPNIGSDARHIETQAVLSGDHYVLNGTKKWITYGQLADVFLLFAQINGQPTAFLVEKNRPGLSIEPINGMYGTRASMLAELRLNDCRIPKENILGKEGTGFPYVALHVLEYGKYSVACGAVGIAQACLEDSIRYTESRIQFKQPLKEFQLVQAMIAEMLANTKAARLLCLNAGFMKQNKALQAGDELNAAKYFASQIAVKAANDAVQLHGANGCSNEYSVQRYLRDAKITEIIEGSTQIQQMNIATYGYLEYGTRTAAASSNA